MTIEMQRENNWLRVGNLQTFADGGDPGAGDGGQGDGKDTSPEGVTLTQEELDKKIEAEADRKLASALEKKQAEWDANLEEKLSEAKKDAEAYAKMTAQEKENAEYKKRLEKLDAREKEINNRQLVSEIELDLKDKDLPQSVSDLFVLLQDNEKIKERMGTFEKEINDFINQRVKEALRQDTPATGGGITKTKGGQSIAEMAREARIIKN